VKAHGQGHGAPGIEPVSLPIPPEGLGLDGLGAARSGAPEGARKKTRGVCAENSDSNVLVMQPTDHGVRYDTSDPLNRPRDRRILVQ
jgi:hypothetical protein